MHVHSLISKLATFVLTFGAFTSVVAGAGCVGDLDTGSQPPTKSSSTQLIANESHGRLQIQVLKAADQHELTFGDFEIRLAVQGQTPLSLDAEVNLASIGGGPSGLSDDLRSEPFFDLEHYPRAQVTAKDFVAVPDHPDQWSASGELTLKEVSYPTEIELELRQHDGVWDGKAQMVLDPAALGFEHPLVDAEMVHSVVVAVDVELPVGLPVGADTVETLQ